MAPRRGRSRDRRGRGPRGPLALAGPLAPDGVPLSGSRRDQFDAVVARAADRLRRRWSERLARVELCVEDVPDVGPHWSGTSVRLVDSTATGPGTTRVVVYRMPLLARAADPDAVALLVREELAAELAELWGLDVEDVDPGV